jgi:sugar O-acyltransferase (sialic acid O-acetyltransferase NeuD family)
VSQLLIFPCNGNAVEALDCLGDRYRAIAFVDDDASRHGTSVHGVPVHGRSAFERWPDAEVLAVPGSPDSYRGRRAIVEGLGLDPRRFACIVHPAARLSKLCRIGRNVLVMAGVVVTADAVIGDHVCVLPNSVIHHDARIGDWTLLGSNVTVAGRVVVGANCYIASGSSLKHGLSIGDGALVGLASTVIRDVAAGARVAGNPARALDGGERR